MPDIYLYDDAPILRNKLQIKDEKTLELIEAEQSRANIMLLYEQGFHDFSPDGLRQIHRFLFGDIYDENICILTNVLSKGSDQQKGIHFCKIASVTIIWLFRKSPSDSET